MQAGAYVSESDSSVSIKVKANDQKKNKNRKLKKNLGQDDEDLKNSDLDQDKSQMSSSSSDSSSSISFSSDSSQSGKAKRKNRKRKKTRSSSNDSSSDSSLSLSITSSEFSFSESESEQQIAQQDNLEEGEINDPEPRSSPVSPTHVLSQLKKYKAEVSRLKKKIRSVERDMKHVTKKIKQHPSTKKSKQRRKLEKKLGFYKSKINGLLSRQTNLIEKYPHLNEHLSSKKKQKSKKKSSKKRESKSPLSSNQVKIPYPVLNDKREMSIIREILEEKQKNLNEMLTKTCQTLEMTQKSSSDGEKITRLNNLKENIRIQLQRLNRQLEYVKLNLEIKNFEEKLTTDQSIDQRNDLNRRLLELRRINENLISQMKEANRKYLNNIENKDNDSLSDKKEFKNEPSSFTVSANPVTYRQANSIQITTKVQNLNSMTPPTSSASSSSSSSSITHRPQQSFPRSQVKTPPLPGNQNFQNQQKYPRFAKVNNKNANLQYEGSECSSQLNRSNNLGYSPSPNGQNNQDGYKNNRNNFGNQMPNFENMFQNPQFIQSMMNVANDDNGNGLLPFPKKSGSNRSNENPKNQMFNMFEQYFNKFASGMGLGHMSQTQIYSLFETMQQNGNFSFANHMMMNTQMNNSKNQFNSARQSSSSRFNNNSNLKNNKQNNMNEFRFNKRNNSNLDNCQNKKQKF